jgi:hypothetical protein
MPTLDAKSAILLARSFYRVDALGLPGNLMCKLTSSLISIEKRFREFDVEMVPNTVEKKNRDAGQRKCDINYLPMVSAW